MQKQFFTLDDFDFKGKTVLCRVDINLPFLDKEKKTIEDASRVAEHCKTIAELSQKGAKAVILAHQGRKGKPDLVSLQHHAELLGKHLGKPVKFIAELATENSLQRVKQLKEGDVLLLENVRFDEDETKKLRCLEDYAQVAFIRRLCSVSDCFVNDAFSVSHRAQASVVGPAFLLPAFAGRVMQRELEGLARAAEHAERPVVYLLGGAKPDDVFELLKYCCDKNTVDKFLLSGVIGELCLLAKGKQLGENPEQEFGKEGYLKLLPELKTYVEKYSSKLVLPLDLAVEENGERKEHDVEELAAVNRQPKDVGKKTISVFCREIAAAKTIYFKGPVGVYEEKLFEKGTREILKAIAASPAYSLFGGGHSVSALEKFGVDKNEISFVSLAGGAVVDYLQGKALPGVEALKQSCSKRS